MEFIYSLIEETNKIAICARVSTKEKGQDTGNQLHQLREFVERHCTPPLTWVSPLYHPVKWVTPREVGLTQPRPDSWRPVGLVVALVEGDLARLMFFTIS
jgi:hypothetical protein